jgi:hypothetical protein
MSTLGAHDGQVTKHRLGEEEIRQRLRDKAKVPDGDGPDAEALAHKLACSIFKHVDSNDKGATTRVCKILRDEWLPRWGGSWDAEKLFGIVEAAFEEHAAEAAEAEKRAKERAHMRAAERKAIAERPAGREAPKWDTRLIARKLGVGTRQAQHIARDGTTDPKQAAQLVALFPDTKPRDWLREPGRRGQEPDVLEWINSRHFRGCTLRDFAQHDHRLGGKADELVAALCEGYLDGRVSQAHFRTLDEFKRHARHVEFGIEEANAVWDAYQFWRLRKVFELAEGELWG